MIITILLLPLGHISFKLMGQFDIPRFLNIIALVVDVLQESSTLPTAFDPWRTEHCHRRMIRGGQPSEYRLGVDLPRRRRADPRCIRSPRRTGPMPTARGTLGVLALGVAAHGSRQAKRQLGHTPRASRIGGL
jgi:hypothetical protein